MFYLKLEWSAQKIQPQPAIEQWLCIITTTYIKSSNLVCGVALVHSEYIFASGLCMYSKLIPPMYISKQAEKNHVCFLLFEVLCNIIQVKFIASLQCRYFILLLSCVPIWNSLLLHCRGSLCWHFYIAYTQKQTVNTQENSGRFTLFTV